MTFDMSAYQIKKPKKEKQKKGQARKVKVLIPDNVPLDKAPWDSLPDALARGEITQSYARAMEKAGSDPQKREEAKKLLDQPYEVQIVLTQSNKKSHLD
jgi:hypothetical protein